MIENTKPVQMGITEAEAHDSMRRLAYWEGKQQEKEMQYEAALQPYRDAIAAIEERREQEILRISKHKDYHKGMIEMWARNAITADSKRKTVDMPFGTVSGRKGTAKWLYDDDKLLAFVRENMKKDCLRVTESVDKAALKKAAIVDGEIAVTSNGEIIPGVTIVEQPMTYTVKPLVLQTAPDAEDIETEKIKEVASDEDVQES